MEVWAVYRNNIDTQEISLIDDETGELITDLTGLKYIMTVKEPSDCDQFDDNALISKNGNITVNPFIFILSPSDLNIDAKDYKFDFLIYSELDVDKSNTETGTFKVKETTTKGRIQNGN